MGRFDRLRARLDSRILAKVGDDLSLNGAPLGGTIDAEQVEQGELLVWSRVLSVPRARAAGLRLGDVITDNASGERWALVAKAGERDGLAAFELEKAP